MEKVFGESAPNSALDNGGVSASSNSKSLGIEDFKDVASEIVKIPKIFGEMLFTRVESRQDPKIGLPKSDGKAKVTR